MRLTLNSKTSIERVTMLLTFQRQQHTLMLQARIASKKKTIERKVSAEIYSKSKRTALFAAARRQSEILSLFLLLQNSVTVLIIFFQVCTDLTTVMKQ